MRSNWRKWLSGLALVGALSCLGCGPGSTSVNENQTQSPEDYQKEIESQGAEIRGDVNLSKPPAEASKPAPESGTEEEEATP